MATNKLVSVIIPCWNEEKYISQCLDSIIANDYPKEKLEVLVVDGISQDKTREVVKSYAQKYNFIKLVDNLKRFKPYAFNLGIQKADGEIIMIVGAHASIEKDYISQCVKYLNEYQADNVGGVMVTVPRENTLLAQSIALALSSPFGVGNARFRIGSKKPILVDTVFGGCFRKELFRKIGFFNEELIHSQDLEFNLRLKKHGGKILLVPEIKSYYYALSDFKSYCRHNFRNGLWAVYPLKFVQHIPVSVRHLVPLVFVSSLITSGILGLFSPAFLWLLGLISSLYLMTSLYYSAKIALAQKNLRLVLVMPFIFSTLHLVYGFGSLVGFFKVLSSSSFWKNKFKTNTYHLKEKNVEWFDKLTIKRLFDFVFSLIGVIIFLPLFVVIGLLIKLDSQGPVFYRGVRVGRFGKNFRIYKFRTMVQNAEKLGGSSTPDDDPRLTQIGKFLRNYKLDEAPQLFNVLKGDMSFVGPRPQVPEDVALYTEQEKALLSVLPGITDYASIRFHNEGEILKGSPDPGKTYVEKIRPEKINLGLQYVQTHSLWVDIKIIFLTFKTLFQVSR